MDVFSECVKVLYHSEELPPEMMLQRIEFLMKAIDNKIAQIDKELNQ